MKYSYEEKLAAVLSVVNGQHSVSSASKHFGISYTPLSRWIARYKEFGEAGLRIRQYTYSGDFKLSAIRHMHENHLSLTETTAKFGIYNESTLSKWERIYYEEGESGLYRDNRGKMRTKPNKQELQPQEENDLRVENQRLRAEVAYLKKDIYILQCTKLKIGCLICKYRFFLGKYQVAWCSGLSSLWQ